MTALRAVRAVEDASPYRRDRGRQRRWGALARIQNVYYNGSTNPALGYGYAANGALGSLTDYGNNRLTVYRYDGLDRLSGMTESFDGEAVQIYRANYDEANRVSGTEYRVSPQWNGELRSARSYGYTYNSANGSLSGMTLPGGGAYSYQYDALKRLNNRSLTLNNSPFLTREYGYVPGTGTDDTTTLVGALTNKKGNGTTLNGWTYTYDATGRITSISDGTEAWSYTYDAQGQMLSEQQGSGEAYYAASYVYDTAGNIRSKSSGGNTVSYSYGNAQWPDLLTAYDGHSISYDAGGNPTTWYDGATMTWAKGRQLASIGATNGHAALSFTYNADGLRLTKTVGTGANAVEHCYTWQGDKLIAEAFEDTELEFFYDESGAPYALLVRDLSTVTPTEAWYFYVTNLQGDVVMLLDASGNTFAEYSYNAWGNVLNASGSLAEVNPLRYRGYYYDVETGLYYLQSRYYDPAIGRFINADGYASTGQGIIGCNMFAYCGNEPVDMIDSDGLFPVFPPEWVEEVGEIVETIIGGLYYVTTYTRRGELYEHWVYPSGDPAHSRHYSDHGNQKTHPLVPHDHDWHDDGNGNMREDKEFQPVNPGFAAPGSKKSNADTDLIITGGIAVGLIIYEGGKWLIAVLTAAPTGGGSLAVAALVP